MTVGEELRNLTDEIAEAEGLRDNQSAGSGRAARDVARIALLTPYTGNNLGDAAIVDAMIANIRARLPGAQFSGICLNCDNFVDRHGVHGFALCGTDRPFHAMSRGSVADRSGAAERFAERHGEQGNVARIKRALVRVPILGAFLRRIYACARDLWCESRHCIQGHRFLRTQDLLIVSGGGQLDEEWGGPWGHPFTLFKWAVLARSAQIPCAIASVGACKVTSTTARFFLSAALRMAQYRSYRDKNSREIAAGLLRRAGGDVVVPDPVFSMPCSELPQSAGTRSMAQGRTIVVLSPIAYAKPGSWPYPDSALYDRYLWQMSQVVSKLLNREYFLVIVGSALSDESVIDELLRRLDDDSKRRLDRRIHIPAIATWKDLVATLLDADFVIASRLHSAILSFVARKPTIAISFDPKVDWVMEDLGQTEYLLQIHNFSVQDVIQALERIKLRENIVAAHINRYQLGILSASSLQYDTLTELALTKRRSPTELTSGKP